MILLKFYLQEDLNVNDLYDFLILDINKDKFQLKLKEIIEKNKQDKS